MDLKKVFSLISIPLVLVILYTSRVLYFGGTYEDAPILAILAFIYAATMYFKTKEIVLSENLFRNQVNEEMGKMKGQLSRLQLNSNNPFGGTKLGSNK